MLKTDVTMLKEDVVRMKLMGTFVNLLTIFYEEYVIINSVCMSEF